MSRPVYIDEIIARWQERRAEWSRFHVQVDGAALADEAIADLDRIAAGDGQTTLTLTDASSLSGYSTDHLSRLIRQGKLRNYGKKGKPLVRRSELPIRPSTGIASARNRGYDPITDARLSLGVRR